MSEPKDPGNVRVGATLRALREAHGLKLIEMAVAVGISHPYLSNIEAGRKAAPIPVCKKAAKLFRVPLAAITIEGYDEIRAAAEKALRDESDEDEAEPAEPVEVAA
jgi:transcriptional regulator with XRE-family HTH domain